LAQRRAPVTISSSFSSSTVNSSSPLHTGQTRISISSLFIVGIIISQKGLQGNKWHFDKFSPPVLSYQSDSEAITEEA